MGILNINTCQIFCDARLLCSEKVHFKEEDGVPPGPLNLAYLSKCLQRDAVESSLESARPLGG